MVSVKFHEKIIKGFLKIANIITIKIKKIIDFFKKFFFTENGMINKSSYYHDN